MKLLAVIAFLIILIRPTQGIIFECRSGHPVANAYCSDYCRSLHRGNHVAGSCAKDEVSCLCETSNNTRVKVRIMQDQEPVPYTAKPATVTQPHPPSELGESVEDPVRVHRRPQQLPRGQLLNCDGSPIAESTCNSFCIDVAKGSGGQCHPDTLTCGCRDVPHVKNEPIPAVYVQSPQLPQQSIVAPLPALMVNRTEVSAENSTTTERPTEHAPLAEPKPSLQVEVQSSSQGPAHVLDTQLHHEESGVSPQVSLPMPEATALPSAPPQLSDPTALPSVPPQLSHPTALPSAPPQLSHPIALPSAPPQLSHPTALPSAPPQLSHPTVSLQSPPQFPAQQGLWPQFPPGRFPPQFQLRPMGMHPPQGLTVPQGASPSLPGIPVMQFGQPRPFIHGHPQQFYHAGAQQGFQMQPYPPQWQPWQQPFRPPQQQYIVEASAGVPLQTGQHEVRSTFPTEASPVTGVTTGETTAAPELSQNATELITDSETTTSNTGGGTETATEFPGADSVGQTEPPAPEPKEKPGQEAVDTGHGGVEISQRGKFVPPPLDYTGWKAIPSHRAQERMHLGSVDKPGRICTTESCGKTCESPGLAGCFGTCVSQNCFCSCPRLNAWMPNRIVRMKSR